MRPDIKARFERINHHVMSTTPTLLNSYQCARDVVAGKVPGALVECGVYAGSQCGAMALAVQELRGDRKIHLFDSFKGFPKASVKDDPEWQERLGVGSSTEDSKPLDPAWGFSVEQSAAVVRARFRQWGFPDGMFVFHEGWFQDTVPGWQGDIAVLRIDGDLYESTKVCLEHLYPHLVPGGFCIMDDYMLGGCRKAFDEYFQGTVQPIEIVGGLGPHYWMKG